MDSNAHGSGRSTDIFEIGLYALEAAIVIAVMYAIAAFPAWLRPMT
jgi:hypothetical protein